MSIESLLALPCAALAVIFDMDGTLLDTESIRRVSMQTVAREMGGDLPDEVFFELIGVHRERNRETLLDHFGRTFPIEDFYREAEARFTELWRKTTPLRPGARTALASLRGAGLPIGIATSTNSPAAEERLDQAGIADFFAAVVTRSHVALPKPDPESYVLAARLLNIADRSRCVAVEDSSNGLRAAAAAGMMGLFVPDLVPATPELVALATAIVPSLDGAARLILAPPAVPASEASTADRAGGAASPMRRP